MFALVRYTLLLVLLLTFTTCHSDNKHDLQQNTALAIVRTSAPRETPMALKLSATTAVVESERALPLLLGPTHRPSIFAFVCLLNHHPNALFMSNFVLQVSELFTWDLGNVLIASFLASNHAICLQYVSLSRLGDVPSILGQRNVLLPRRYRMVRWSSL